MKVLKIFAVIAVVLSVSGCNQTKEVLGFNRQINDEFTVSMGAPLTLPPNYNELPEPIKGNARSEARSKTSETAKEIAFSQLSGSHSKNNTSISKSETSLLASIDSQEIDKDIRQTLDREAQIENGKSDAFVEKLLSFKDEGQGKQLNAKEEQKRLNHEQTNIS